MRNSSLTMSGVFHVTVVIAAMVSLPWLKKDLDIPPPMVVEFAEIGPIAQTTKFSQTPTPKQEKEEKKEEPPPPAPKNTSKEAAVPAPKKPEPKTEKKEEPKKEAKPQVDPNAKPDKKKPPKKEEKETPPEPQRDFTSVLKNLAESKPTPPSAANQPDMGLNEAKPVEGQNAPLGAKMTMREEDALRRQLEKCWNVPFGAKDAENLDVEIFMVINPDRTLREARVVDSARYNRDSFFRAAADSALRAVRSPLCSPFEVPPDKYDVWKSTTVNFNPREMF